MTAPFPARALLVARTITAIVGGYAAAAGLVSLAARVAPGDRAEATIWGMVLSFLVYAAIILWAFHEQRLGRVALAVWGAALGTIAAIALLGPAA